MSLLQVNIESHDEGGVTLLHNLELAVNDGERLGLVGHNGCGKSTLLALLAGTKTPDVGVVRTQKGLRIAMVEQFIPGGLEECAALAAVLDASPGAPQSWQAEALLFQLGFDEARTQAPLRTLSGGQQTLVLFARTLLREPELLLLDEPSNHLDVASLLALEGRLRDYRGAFVIVSHDRRFLDRVTRETLFLRDQALVRIARPYSEARHRLDAMDEAARTARVAEDRRIDSLRRSAQRLAMWGRNFDNEDLSKRARSMHRRIERLETQRTFVTRGSPLSLSLELGASRSKLALAVEDVRVLHPGDAGTPLFAVPDMTLRSGDRAALLGDNGVGKSTFVRAIVEAAGREDGDASIRLSPQTRLGYFDQELAEVRGEVRLIEYVYKQVAGDRQAIQAALAGAGFDRTSRDKPLDVLSGGERARLLFTLISLRRPNFLILDEPTNHLDIEGREQMQAALAATSATLLITSHDRLFIETLANRFFLIADGVLLEMPSPDAFFSGDGDTHRAHRDTHRHDGDTHLPQALPDSEEARLTRLVELESRLEAMLERKPKFQKPAQIKRWREEIARLNEAL